MVIKVLGSGCRNCKKLLENVNEAVESLKLNVEVEYVTDFAEISKYNILKTPGLIFDEKIVSYGKVPSKEEVIVLLKDYQN
jgi:small redox-active disulfide protein 2